MLDNYVIINKKILPETYIKVLKAKEILQNNKKLSISDVTKNVGISRSTYYKYKDNMYLSSKNKKERKIVISFLLSHKKGLLVSVLMLIKSVSGNIITINQNIPINDVASVTISMDISEMDIEIDKFIEKLSSLEGISKIELVSME